MESDNDNCDSMTLPQNFYFYPRIYSDKCHFDLAWYKKIFYFIRLMPRIYFHKFKTVCSMIFLGKVSADKEYVGEFLGYNNEEKVPILGRILVSLYFIYVFVWPFLDLCIFVTSLFITIPLGIMQACLINISFVFLIALLYCVMFLALSDDVGVEEKLYACNCGPSKDIHWSIDQCELRNIKEADKRKLLYPGQITEIKLDDIHNECGHYLYRLN